MGPNLLYLMFLSTIWFQYASSNTINDANNLMTHLFNSSTYHVEVRPIMNQSYPLTIDITASLVSLGGVDEVSGKISVVLVFSMLWYNDILVWDPALFGGLDSLVLPKAKVWVPDLFLVNPADDIRPIGNKHMKVGIFSDGQVRWNTGGSVISACSIDMRKFPFDEQTCEIKILPWGYFKNQIDFLFKDRESDRSRYTDNGEWTLISAVSGLNEFEDITEIKFDVTIKRKPLYFILSVIIPIATLCAMNPIVFILPIESGERVSYSITLSLSFVVFMSMTSNIIPQSSEPMSNLIFFLFGSQLLSGIIATVNAFIIKIYAFPHERKINKVFVFLVRAIRKPTCTSHKLSAVVERLNPSDLSIVSHDNQDNNQKPSNDDTENDHIGNDEQPQVSCNQSPACNITWTQVGKTLDLVAFLLSYIFYMAGIITFIVLILT